jgi:hypothetical protein
MLSCYVNPTKKPTELAGTETGVFYSLNTKGFEVGLFQAYTEIQPSRLWKWVVLFGGNGCVLDWWKRWRIVPVETPGVSR